MSDGSDLAWLGLERGDEGWWSIELTRPLSRQDGRLYGGTGIAMVIAALEAETARDAVWASVQFAGSAEVGERIDCHVEVLARGQRTSQARMTATVGDRIVLAGIGAAGVARVGPVEIEVPSMPSVPPPEECEDWASSHLRWWNDHIDAESGSGEQPAVPGWDLIAETRHTPDGEAIWARMRSGLQTRATLAFLADMVPASVVRAAGKVGVGTSLDNSARFGRLVDTEWMLLDMDPWLGAGGYIHGAGRMWAEDGTLLGVASQTASAVVWEAGDTPRWLAGRGDR